MQEDGKLESERKKQASRLKREMRKIKSNLDGIRNMSRLPGAVIVIDAKKEYLALREAKKLGIATVGVLDTDSDPDTVDVAIPANDDSIRAIDLILNELADAVAIGKTMVSTRPEPKQRPRRVRSKRPGLARADKAEAQTVVATKETSTKTAESTPEGEAEQPEPKQSTS
jgi:small subunit ribosomal protein S2